MIDLNAAGPASLERETEFCVVGAGVAGQTVARRLAARGRRVVLVESGGLDFNREAQNLAAGESVGFDYYDLDQARLRIFGGSTAIWGGRCAALDPIDFERRPWVPHSGWPIAYAELDPYVDEAFAALGLDRMRGLAALGVSSPFDPEKIDAPLWTFDGRSERFTDVAALENQPIEIALNATLAEIRTTPEGVVSECRFRSFRGGALTVRAKRYVLAAGGIETPRLLLAAAPDRPEGLGNGHDLVGRFFMEHPHARGGEIAPAAPTAEGYAKLLALGPRSIAHRGGVYAAAFRPAEAAQRARGALNTAATFFTCRREGEPDAIYRRVLSTLRQEAPATKLFRRLFFRGKHFARSTLAPLEDRVAAWRLPRAGARIGIFTVIRAEQAPNPDSRVKLAEERDALGLRRAALDWRLSAIDRDSVSTLMGLFDEELTRLGIGRAIPARWLSEPGVMWKPDPLVSTHPIAGYHHMGTTRMAATPREGVTDANCRVFESPNLYIAGSSLFPTSGWANPTITILALAMRLGDHLATKAD
ncbi:GMC family oxidoreductase [Pikeienuella piscinae]|uniref:GMC family oxidoreductase n=1 Tax=Pikeienuella piscinae TaxID=2748098 RepID=UPI001BA6EB5D|nr:GMC family oxidoreductase [Pikeienuella piscinae]